MKNILEIKRAEKQRRERILDERRYQDKVRFANMSQTHLHIASAKLFILSTIITIFMMFFLCFTHKQIVLPMLCLIFSLYTKTGMIYADYITSQMATPFDDANRKAEKIEMSAFASFICSIILIIITLIQYSL
jgi:hypothetical protein